MTARGLYTLLFSVLMLFTALSVSSGGAFLLGAAALIAWAVSFVTVLLALFTCHIEQESEGGQSERGGTMRYVLRIRMFSPLIAPLMLRVCLPSGRTHEFMLKTRLLGETASDNDFPCPHVGVFPVGVERLTITDCFGLFSLTHRVRDPLTDVTVLPRPRESAPVHYSPGEGETSMAQRAHADRTTPSDTRAWQEGDELKRVHWKLSMRRQELMVHTYETPQRPDALVLLDCAQPEAEDKRRADVIDALTEQCAGVLKGLLEAKRTVRMPMTGDMPREMSGDREEALPGMLKALAQESFSRPADFAHVLMLSSRRMRRTGSTIILSSRLTPSIADVVIALGQMGPHTRFTLVTAGAPTQEQEQLLHLLRASGVEAGHEAA